MGHVHFALNQLSGREPELAARFEREIEEAVAATGSRYLHCRILAGQGGLDARRPDRVTVLLHAAGWVKAFGLPLETGPGEVHAAVLKALGAPRVRRAVSAAV